jgi:hypothetical protein
MGYAKEKRNIVTDPAQTLGSTGGTIQAYPTVTVVTATATGVVYTLPTPSAGLQKTVVIDYTGATGNVSVVNPTTAIFFNGSTANIITVTSSQEQAVIQLTGVSATQWAAVGSITSFSVTTASSFDYPINFAGSTVVA